MPKRSSKARRDRDENQIAADIVARLTGESGEPPADEAEARKMAARLLGSRGGRRGGPARAAKLSAKRRSEIAKAAARKRWSG